MAALPSNERLMQQASAFIASYMPSKPGHAAWLSSVLTASPHTPAPARHENYPSGDVLPSETSADRTPTCKPGGARVHVVFGCLWPRPAALGYGHWGHHCGGVLSGDKRGADARPVVFSHAGYVSGCRCIRLGCCSAHTAVADSGATCKADERHQWRAEPSPTVICASSVAAKGGGSTRHASGARPARRDN
ncbi:hypothetical protein CHLRE_01g051875v5 [Chlamydomonas reinhardtii]|uniref:Uncharacterized protein n=1 Tax=Chlamydomonas reinhardtii TaxID=3055 RepID=A0A2K3E841_CHLRE|nr:uncharacterized protein CHLRE_01g051875v5 [Chlamydomonas reinhardtii]PNW88954.1 hypothetical protein CHLRE_01g051875v5 [Chlamydomonas reinhardtii]